MSRSMQPRSAPRHARGISLIEVLVSVLVLGVGLLGIAAMQAMALRSGQGSMETSQAVMQTNSIIEAMRANKPNAGSYNTGTLATCSASFSGGTLAANDLNAWVTSLKATLGTPGDTSTCVLIRNCPTGCNITVQWDDTRAGGASNRRLTTTGVRI